MGIKHSSVSFDSSNGASSSSSVAAAALGASSSSSVMSLSGGHGSSGRTNRVPTIEEVQVQLERTLQSLVTRMKAPRMPINIIISGPPGCDTRVLCQFLSRECGLVYDSIDPIDQEPSAPGAGDSASSASSSLSSKRQYYSRHAIERDQGSAAYLRHLREAEQVVASYCRVDDSTTHAEVAARVMSQHLLNMQRFVFRHLKNVPTTDSMINADRSVWQRSLWRVFHGAPNDEMYGYASTSSEMRLIDRGMYAVIQAQGKMAMDVMFKDCSPSNTLWIYCAPKRDAYHELVDMAVGSTSHSQHASSLGFNEEQMRRYYWQTYHFMDNMYRQSVFTTGYWSLHLETQTPFMDRVTMLSIANVVLTYLVDTLFEREFWCSASIHMRQTYLSLTQTISDRVKFVPSFAPPPTTTTSVNIPPLTARGGIRDSSASSTSSALMSAICDDNASYASSSSSGAGGGGGGSGSTGIVRSTSSSSVGNHRRPPSPARSASDHRIERVKQQAVFDGVGSSSSNSSSIGSLQSLRAPLDPQKERRRQDKERRLSAAPVMQVVDLGV